MLFSLLHTEHTRERHMCATDTTFGSYSNNTFSLTRLNGNFTLFSDNRNSESCPYSCSVFVLIIFFSPFLSLCVCVCVCVHWPTFSSTVAGAVHQYLSPVHTAQCFILNSCVHVFWFSGCTLMCMYWFAINFIRVRRKEHLDANYSAGQV